MAQLMFLRLALGNIVHDREQNRLGLQQDGGRVDFHYPNGTIGQPMMKNEIIPLGLQRQLALLSHRVRRQNVDALNHHCTQLLD